MMRKVEKRRSARVDIRKSGHRRGRRGLRRQEHRELIHEVALRGFCLGASEIDSGGKVVAFETQGSAEKPNLVRLRFEVLAVWMCKDEIKNGQTLVDEVELVGTAIAGVLAFNLTG